MAHSLEQAELLLQDSKGEGKRFGEMSEMEYKKIFMEDQIQGVGEKMSSKQSTPPIYNQFANV